MEKEGFHYEWVTIRNHRILLHCRTGFPDDRMRFIARVAVETCDWQSSSARVLKVFFDDKSDMWSVDVATTDPRDSELENTLSTIFDAMYGTLICIPRVGIIDACNSQSDSYNHTEYLSMKSRVATGDYI